MNEEKSNVIPFKKPEDETRCSFCRALKAQCKKLIASQDGRFHICDKCVATATERLFQEADA